MNQEEFENKIVGLKSKYQEQFQKIFETNENFKGDFNWMAFLFGIIWALSKGLWLVSLVAILVAVFTSGIGAIFFWLSDILKEVIIVLLFPSSRVLF